MPHLSPMQWTMMLTSSWALLSIITTSLFFINGKPMMSATKASHYNHTKWNWFQDLL